MCTGSGTVDEHADASKRLAARFYQPKTGHCQCLAWANKQPTAKWQGRTNERTRKNGSADDAYPARNDNQMTSIGTQQSGPVRLAPR